MNKAIEKLDKIGIEIIARGYLRGQGMNDDFFFDNKESDIAQIKATYNEAITAGGSILLELKKAGYSLPDHDRLTLIETMPYQKRNQIKAYSRGAYDQLQHDCET